MKANNAGTIGSLIACFQVSSWSDTPMRFVFLLVVYDVLFIHQLSFWRGACGLNRMDGENVNSLRKLWYVCYR